MKFIYSVFGFERDAEGSNGDGSSGCQMEGHEEETYSLLPDDQKNMAQQVLPADDAVLAAEEILYDSRDEKYPDGLPSGPDTTGERWSEICDADSKAGDFNDPRFNLKASNSTEMNDLRDVIVSERAKDEKKRSCSSLMALEPAANGRSIPSAGAEDRAGSSFESRSLIAEEKNGNRLVVTDDSAAEINGRNVSAGNEEALISKAELFSDDNNNFLVGII